jgi:hypothetical protein
MHEPPLLVIMAKAPVSGAVNTRLAKDVGAAAATALARTLTATLLREVVPDRRFRTVLAISPDQACHAPFVAWSLTYRLPGTATRALSGIAKSRDVAHRSKRPRTNAKALSGVTIAAGQRQRICQGRGDIGQRMQRIFDRWGRGPLIIVGTDIPFITREIIAKAFHQIRRADAVLGSAEDGGYWLVGLRRRPRRLAPFENVRWSSPHALPDTLKNLCSHRIAFAATLFDIDTERDYRRYLRARSYDRNCLVRYNQPDHSPPK